MKRLIYVITVLIAFISCKGNNEKSSVTINGAGATFPYPIYSQWASKYHNLSGLKLNYQSIGSGGGIAQIKAKTVDFGASDAPLTADELNESGLIQFPMVIGGVVPVFHIKGVPYAIFKLTPDLLARIFLGKIKKWNDPAIKALNPDLNLPDLGITVVHRADGSGTTWIFTSYLAKVSPEWQSKVGVGKVVNWPVGVGGKGNEGISAYVQQIEGAIGYVEYAYAAQVLMSYTLLQNRDGAFVAPTIETFKAAAANADWKNAPGYYMVLVDQPGKDSWPITGASFILIQKNQPDPAKARAMLGFFDWCYKHGANVAKSLYYVPMPMNVVDMVEETWSDEVKSDGRAVWK